MHKTCVIYSFSQPNILQAPRFKNSYFSTKTYVVGTQKNCLNETVFLSTQKHVQTDG